LQLLMHTSTGSQFKGPFEPISLSVNLAGFAFNGVLMGIYGPILANVGIRFTVDLPTAGSLVGIHFLGALIGALAFWKLQYRRSPRILLRLTYAALAIGLTSVVVASSFTLFSLLCVGVLFAGVGFGGLDYGLSQIFATGYGSRKTGMLNLLHGSFGLGTALGPLILGFVGIARYPGVFVVGALIATTGIFFSGRGDVSRASLAEARKTRISRSASPLLSVSTSLFVLIYILHIAVQGSIGTWEPTQLEALGYPPGSASLWTAGFWFGIAASRLALAFGRLTVSPGRIVYSCCAATCIIALLTLVVPVLPLTYMIFGFFIGPIFPVGLSWLSDRLREPDDGIAAVVIISMVGGIVFPPLLGVAIYEEGIGIMPAALVGLSIIATGTAWMLQEKRIPCAGADCSKQ
jgi:MFS transporter, FHS family, glucose/mannose:H+ symporter